VTDIQIIAITYHFILFWRVNKNEGGLQSSYSFTS